MGQSFSSARLKFQLLKTSSACRAFKLWFVKEKKKRM